MGDSPGGAAPLSLRQLLSRRWEPGGLPILVIGDSMLDVYVSGSVDRISPEAPVPVIRQLKTRESVGGAANVAANIGGMGGICHLISCVGMDAEGDRMAGLLHTAVTRFDLLRDSAHGTTVKTRMTAGQHQLLRLDREESDPISRQSEDAVLATVAQRLQECRLMVISDYNKGTLTDKVLMQAIAMARANDVPVLVDPKRRDFTRYRGAAVIKPNRAELAAATGLPVKTDAEIERAAAAAASITGAHILVTRSEAGMTLFHADGAAVHLPTLAREVFDVTGAGDTVMAAFATALASGRTMEEAMAFANVAGGLAVSKLGTAIVSADEIEAEAERARMAEDRSTVSGGLATVDEAVELRALWRSQGLTVGFTNGCFDLLHPGHVALLREAAGACDRLIVGLNADASVKRLKGPTRPVQDEAARATVLAALRHVNLVVLFEEDTPRRLIERLMPDLLVKGADHKVEDIVGADIVVAAGGRVMTVELVEGQSTTRLIARGRAPADAD
ncbi:MAG: D-glycero-beta-D-manno-heptose-7-phosphate kinase [Enhydrobacter sp.]|nr:MAG: D-glycero-beta-D-manno-heptose-7-phosphate kinase [Enhydrobacter sp.]